MDASSPGGLEQALREDLEALAAKGQRRTLGGEPSARAPFTGCRLDLLSNDYLGLAADPRMVAAGEAALREHGAGGRAARLLGGGSPSVQRLEGTAAQWAGVGAALFLPSGYQANLALLGALTGAGDLILSDELNHASLIDGIRLARATCRVFAHSDLRALEAQLLGARGFRRVFIVVESVFSMDGDPAPLAEIAELAHTHGAWVIVDEAHAAGLRGPKGAGLWAEVLDARSLAEGPAARVVARTITGGKSFGAAGALIAGSRALVDTVINRGRGFIYTTASPPVVPALFECGLRLAAADEALRHAPRRHARAFALALDLPEPAGAIVPVVLGSEAAALDGAARLRGLGIEAMAVRPPTVPTGTARLRLTFHAGLDDGDVERVVGAVRAVISDRIPAEHEPRPAPMLAQVLTVAGTDTGAGKTVAAAALVSGLGARYWKPVQTGDDCDTQTVVALAGLPPERYCEPIIRFPLPASPHEAAAAAGGRVPIDAIAPKREELRAADECPLVVELAGGLEVPLTGDVTQLDHLAAHPTRLVLVARSGLGTLNHTLLSLSAARARGLEVAALILVGPRHDSNRETLRRLGRVPLLYELPMLDPLGPDTLQQWASAQDFRGLLE